MYNSSGYRRIAFRYKVMSIPDACFQRDATVEADGRLKVSVPFPAGTAVVVRVVELGDEDGRELQAAESSLEFWGNPWDDEDWNRA